MASNMVERLGADWFNGRCAGGHFVYNGKLMYIRQAGQINVLCTDAKTGDNEKVPVEFFTGFKIFEYPTLGYRKFGIGFAMWLSKRHTYNRGLNERSINQEYSPVTLYLLQKYQRRMGKAFEPPRLVLPLVFFPEYDTVADLPRLFNGEMPCVVLNENVMVEANIVNPKAEGWTVYFRQRPCATIDLTHKFHWFNDGYKQALEGVFKGV